jgi:cell wall-associated NlpC family hydrolase
MQRKSLQTKVVVLVLLLTVLATTAPLNLFSATAEAATSFSNRYSVVKTAYRYLGRPYVFGANGPQSFDCSSFVRYVFRLHGYYLPRTAAAQSTYGKYVKAYNWRYGDLIFFRNTYKKGISHVGLYAGNKKIVHAWPKKGVVVTNFVAYKYLNARYAGAKRILR